MTGVVKNMQPSGRPSLVQLPVARGQWSADVETTVDQGAGNAVQRQGGADACPGCGDHPIGNESLEVATNSTDILPVCETARGVVEVCSIAASSPRIRCALLGAEDLSNDLCAERGIDAVELDYARRRFILEARAAGIEPIDALIRSATLKVRSARLRSHVVSATAANP